MAVRGAVDLDFQPADLRVVLRGEIDASLAEDARRALTVASAWFGSRVEVDARAVTFMDCSGLRLLAWLSGHAERVVLVKPPRIIQFLLEVTDLGDLVSIQDSEVEVLGSRPRTTR